MSGLTKVSASNGGTVVVLSEVVVAAARVELPGTTRSDPPADVQAEAHLHAEAGHARQQVRARRVAAQAHAALERDLDDEEGRR